LISVKQDAQDVTLTRITTYNHQHAKLLLSSLALSVSGVLHDRNSLQSAVDTEYITAASQLFIHCFNIVVDTLATSAKLGKCQLMFIFLSIIRAFLKFSSSHNPAVYLQICPKSCSNCFFLWPDLGLVVHM